MNNGPEENRNKPYLNSTLSPVCMRALTIGAVACMIAGRFVLRQQALWLTLVLYAVAVILWNVPLVSGIKHSIKSNGRLIWNKGFTFHILLMLLFIAVALVTIYLR